MSVSHTEPGHWTGWHWIGRLHQFVDPVDLTPTRVTGVYLTFGFAALYVSDVLLPTLLVDPLLSQVQAVKGGVEVVLTGGLIYLLTRASRASLQQTTDELEAAKRELGVLHRVLRHNLRNNLTIVAGYADQIETEAMNTELEAYCAEIKTTCEEFTDSIEKTKHLADLHANGHRTTDLDLSKVIDRIQADVTREYPDATITIDRPATPDVLAHPHIEFALQELITNGIMHDPSPAPTVEVAAEQSPNDPRRLRIRVEDTGPGIPQDEVEALHRHEETPLEPSVFT